MSLSLPKILRTPPVLTMALQNSFREAGLAGPPCSCKSTSLSPFNRQLRSFHLNRLNGPAIRLRHAWRANCSSSPSKAQKGFGRLSVARISASLHEMAFCAARFSQVLSTLVAFVYHKAMEAKGSGSPLFLLRNVHVNALLTKSHGSLLRRTLSNRMMEHGGLGMALMSTTAMAKDHINPVIATLCANPTFMSGLVAWATAQVLKIFTTFFVERRWDFKMLLGSGGMPSSHSALCVALTTSVALCHGISDALFPVCLGFSLIVMYDATGVRRHAGMQAEVLNLIVEDLFQGHPISEKKLKELLGHTPLQVGAGAFLGIIAGYLCSQGCTSFSGNGF